MVNVFIDLPALHRVIDFQNTYVRMVNALGERDRETAWEQQRHLATQALDVQRDLQRVGLGYITLCDAPILGGRAHVADITVLMTHPDMATQYNLDPTTLMLQLDMAIGEYQRRVTRGRLALLNPLWWLELLLRFLFRLPLRLFRIAGYNTAPFERSGPGKVLQFMWTTLVVMLTLTLAAVSAAAGMQQVGWWEPFLQQLSSWQP
jgi:hypothetical protein